MEAERGKKGRRWGEEKREERVWGNGERREVRPRHDEE